MLKASFLSYAPFISIFHLKAYQKFYYLATFLYVDKYLWQFDDVIGLNLIAIWRHIFSIVFMA